MLDETVEGQSTCNDLLARGRLEPHAVANRWLLLGSRSKWHNSLEQSSLRERAKNYRDVEMLLGNTESSMS